MEIINEFNQTDDNGYASTEFIIKSNNRKNNHVEFAEHSSSSDDETRNLLTKREN